MSKKIKCEFCQSEVDEPTELDKTEVCQYCKAIYWLEFPDDLYLATQEASEHFKVDYDEMFKKIEIKVVRNFDEFGEEGEGEEVCLVFAKQKR